MIKGIILLMILSLSLFAIDITDIIDSIERMNSSTKIPKKIEYNIYDPFSDAKSILIVKNNNDKKISSSLKPIILQTILNNRAFIDGKWYNEGDEIRKYKIKSIGSDSVVLVKNAINTTLRLNMIESILEMKEQER